MTPLAASGPNAEQIQYWNETAGPKWVKHRLLLDAQIRSVGMRAMDHAAVAAGERVIDVGCGCGDTTLELGRRVGPGGAVLGIDISTVMLAQASAAARSAGSAQVRFENVDAQTHRFTPGSFDVLYSRFGVMFFSDPTAAFTNLIHGLRSGGRLAFVCWRDLRENPWIMVPLAAVAQQITLPAPPAPGTPGPFAFADAERVGGILSASGWADVKFTPHEETMTIGGASELDQAVEFLLELGPMGAALREAGPDARTWVAAAVREAVQPFHSADGVRLSGAVWIVTGRKP